ncbi:hypothetical protein TNCV_4719791 [Trichonephila clavipes]|uniref:Uncharacterized protein n=1 Tax=Trichonephila clavipes TaxID=2585209 RepID=A0A8X7BEH4_TRICX|nr:hypothetical protein TNCV_4719791 [Trichonephila clavipes]
MVIFLPSKNTRTSLLCQQNMLHGRILPPDPCTVRVRRDGFVASWNSHQIRRLPTGQNKSTVFPPTTLPVTNPQMSIAFFLETTANESLHFGRK